MINKYFELIRDGYYEPGGVIYASSDIIYPLARDGKPISNWQNLTFTLKDGNYLSYHAVNAGANLVDDELKTRIEEFIPVNYPLEFLPVKVLSEIYGEKQYFIMHFKIIFDVIEPINTVYVDGTKSIIKLCLDYNKVKNLDIFNSQPAINDIIVSDKIRKAIKKRKLDFGIEFSKLHCV